VLDVVYLKNVVSTNKKLRIEYSNILDNTGHFCPNLWLNLVDSEKECISKNYNLISPQNKVNLFFFTSIYKTKGILAKVFFIRYI
jgi:hypothetical protein